MTYKLGVFDIAGTTVADDNAVAIAFCNAFEIHGIKIRNDEIKPLMGYKKTLAIESVLRKNDLQYDTETVEAIHEDFVGAMIDHYANDASVKAMEGAEDVFMELKHHGISITLNTGFPRIIADTIVKRLGWDRTGMVNDYIASDEVVKGRPFPYMIQALMQRNAITDSSTVFKIGDTEVDINEGRNAGCGLVIGVTTGAFTRHQLAEYHPDHIIESLYSLPEILGL